MKKEFGGNALAGDKIKELLSPMLFYNLSGGKLLCKVSLIMRKENLFYLPRQSSIQ